MAPHTVIPWPADLHPGVCPVHVVNTLEIAAPPARVWPWLVRAALWPIWFPPVREVALDGGGLDLAPGTAFTWRIGPMPFHTVVDMWRPAALIGWRGTSLGAEGLQAWRLEPRAGGCLVTTEEVQRGPLPRLLAPLARSVSRATHQLWLTRLATVAIGAPRG